MGEGETVAESAEVSANNNVATEDKSEAFTEKKNAEKDIENMDIDKEVVKESKADEEEKADQESKGAEEKPERKFEVMEEETAEKPVKDKEEVEDVGNVPKEEKEIPEDNEVEKGSKGSAAQKKDRKRKRQVENKKEPEPKTPLASKIERPVRQRKSVERLVASIEGELPKEILIEKGRGTALKDIPNVAYKLSKMKADDTLKLLHTLLFGRRGKAAQFKSNISQFSGFVWHENEEKQKMKVKEKLNKCVKEKLLELCDVLDIPDPKDTSRKEDLESQLMDFLVAPHPTTSELFAEKDQSTKRKKHERASKKSPSSTIGSLEGSTKGKAEKKKKNLHEPKDDQEEGPEKMKANGVQEEPDDETSNQAESEEKDAKSEEKSEKDKKKHKRSSNKLLSNKYSSKGSKKNDNNDANPKVSSKKKTTEVVKGKSSASKKPSSKDNTGNKVLNGKGNKKADKLWPSDNELRSAICEVLKEVDFNTATFTDIVQILAKRYDTDLTPRKSSVKNMIQDELTRLADEADEEDEEETAEEDEKQPSTQSVGS